MPSIATKLQLKAPCQLLLLNVSADLHHLFEEEGITLTIVETTHSQQVYDAVQLFVTQKAELDALVPQAIAALKPGGALWIAYPKKTSAIRTDITRDHGWETISQLGYQGVRQVAIDATWSSLRFKHTSERKEPSKMGTDYPGIDRVARTVTIPEDLHLALKENDMLARFEKMSFTCRKEYVISVLEAKRPETRQKRITKTIEMLQAIV